MLGIKLLEGAYDTESWLEAVRGLEKEPEKGARCSICFDKRFDITALKTYELGEKSFTSTLLTSPKKSLEQLQKAGDRLAQKYGIAFVAPDYRKASGTQEQNIMAKEDKLYRQDYCGCLFGLTMQREQQEKLADELFVPLSRQIQPESIEARMALYKQRWEYEEENIPYRIIKQRFLNWRLLRGLLLVRKVATPAHFLPYSTLRGDYSRGKIEYSIADIHYMSRDEVRFITLEYYNQLSESNYATVEELIYAPPPYEKEMLLRQQIERDFFSLSAILVVDTIPDKKIEILCQSKSYDDVKDILIQL